MPVLRAEDKRDLAREQDDLKRRRDGLRDDYVRVQERRDQLQAALASLRPEMEQLERNLQAAQDAHTKALASITDAEGRLKIIEHDAEEIERKDAEVAARLKEVGELLNPRKTDQDELMAVAERFGEFSAHDVAAVLKITPKQAAARIATQVERGTIQGMGRKVLGKPMFMHLGAVQKEKEAQSESFKLVRDFAVKQKEAFSPAAVTTATEVDGQELVEALQMLLRNEVIQYVGFNDLELYEYTPPRDMGDAARKDADRRKQLAKEAPRANGAAPVAGTGTGLTVSNADVRALVSAIQAAGGTVAKTGGSGHFEVTAPGSNKRVLISSTPSSRRSVLNDRSRVRRELGLRI